jgi:hypothetical protein
MDEPSSPTRRHSVADSIHSPILSFDAVLENSARARFSLDSGAGDVGPHFSHTHPPPKPQPLSRRILVIVILILLWYTFSLILSLYNKWMFAPAHLNFPFPLFVTSLHMLVQFGLSGFALWWFPHLRPKREELLSLRDCVLLPPSN